MLNMINILKGVKGLSALCLFICLFLPLSTCTNPADPKLKKKEVVYERYVVMHKELGLKGYIPVVFFVLPIVVVLLNIRVRIQQLRYELLEFFAGLLALAIAFFHLKTGKLVFGGYMALVSSVIYMTGTLGEIWNIINHRRNECKNTPKNRKNAESEL